MSDDTPTERYDAAGDAPTERLTPAEAAIVDPAAADPEVVEERKSRRTMIILGSIGGALLIILIILLILLLVKPGGTVVPTGSPTPSPTASASASATPTQSASATPTPTPTPTPTATVAPPPPPPPPSGPIKSYTVDDDSVNCDGVDSVPMHFEWEAEGTTLWFGVGTNNAKLAPYDTFPLVYELDFDYQCGQSSGQQTYTISVEQSNGDLTSKTITVTEQ